MRARKVDSNLKEIVKAARALGIRAYIRNDELGDVDAQLDCIHEVWECKTKTGGFTDKQKKYREEGWRIRTVRSVDDVILARAEMTRDATAIQKQRMG